MSPLHNIGRRAKTIGGKPFAIGGNTMQTPHPDTANICPPFSEWELSGGASVTNGVLTLSAIGGRAASPLMPTDGKPYWRFSAECYGEKQSPYSGHPVGVASRVWSSTHYAADKVTPAKNTSGYAGNGHADDIPLGSWGDRYLDGGSWGNTGGPLVYYVRIIMEANSAWVAPPVFFRLPMFIVSSGAPSYTHYYKKGLPQ